MQTCSFTSLDPGKPYWSIRLAESSTNFGSGSEIYPYQFEPVHATGCSDSEDDSSESEVSLSAWKQQINASAWNACPCSTE